VSCRFWGRIVEVGQPDVYHSEPFRLDQLLKPDSKLENLMISRLASGDQGSEGSVRWIHLPENNVSIYIQAKTGFQLIVL
jgi:hypothetical protein